MAAYIGALLIAFVALIALVNGLIASVGGWFGAEDLSLQKMLGVALAPLAWLLGVPWQDASQVGALLGIKTVLNEFIAYADLADLVAAGAIAPRSAVIASYALCGFANFGSLGHLARGDRRPRAESQARGGIARCPLHCVRLPGNFHDRLHGRPPALTSLPRITYEGGALGVGRARPGIFSSILIKTG